jgi:type VI secretion system protein VasG
LAAYSENLTEAAAKGRLDPVIGRDAEIRQVLDILMRRRQNNPLLVGEAGVGKTAVVEGLAGRIAAGDVPPAFREVQLHALDVGSLQAGASMKGEFESRLKQLIAEVQASEKPIILFIDEAHTLVGAGGSPGQGDAANLLKPALARGNLRTIGATTFREFKKHIEKDPALTRRFQTIAVSEPDNETCTNMLRGVARRLADHHGVEVYDEAIGAAVELSRRYLPERQLPDKAVSLLDTACARVAVSQHTDAAPLESACRRVELLQTEREVVERESKVGHRDEERLTALDWEIESAARERDRIRERFRREKKIVDEILGIHRDLLTAEVPPTESSSEGSAAVVPSDESREGEPETATGDPQERLRTLRAELAELQGEEPMVFPALEAGTIAGVISEWTGIPVGRMVRDEIRSLLQLEQDLQQRVVGQNHALARISERIRVSRAGLEDPRKPIGVFLLVGPSGTGKTETALALAERLYGGEQNLITINMSEYQEAHTVSTLRGSPPGYVGYGEGGVLTEAVRRRPYSVVLLDEVEKAHPDVHEIFYQVFDKGTLQDSEGRSVDFRNTILLLTSNTGSDLAMKICADPQLRPEPDAYAEALRDSLREVFPAALLGRLNVVPYYPLDTEAMDLIIELAVGRVRDRLAENYGVDLVCSPEVSSLIRERCTEVESGGRMIESILNTNLLPRLSRSLLRQQMEGRTAGRMEVSVDRSEFRVFFAEE